MHVYIHDPGHQIMKDEEIVEEVVHEGEESDSENEEQTPSCTVTPSQDCAALDCVLEGLESEGDTDPARLMCAIGKL